MDSFSRSYVDRGGRILIPWLSSGIVANPTAGQILLDSGPLSAGTREAQIIVSANIATFCEFQLRNAANSATLRSQVIAVPANHGISIPFPTGLENGENERFRIVNLVNITGQVSVSIVA